MNFKVVAFSAICFCIAGVGCAASNTGGHVVGNPIISEGAAKKMTDTDTSTCSDPKSKDCKDKKKDDKKACEGENCKK